MSSPILSRRLVLQVIGSIASFTGLDALAWAEDKEPLAALRAGGLAILMRHARTTAGSGDPPGYRLDDCATQRNLDDGGRAQAQRVGQWFAKNGLKPARVRNSPWCRCRDTAQLAFGRSEDWAALGNIFDRELEPAHIAEVRSFIAQVKPGEFAVLVSHGVTIGALSGAHPAPAEGVLVRAVRAGEALQVVGRLVVA
jgi:phosphohistidine phosphatase SixA